MDLDEQTVEARGSRWCPILAEHAPLVVEDDDALALDVFRGTVGQDGEVEPAGGPRRRSALDVGAGLHLESRRPEHRAQHVAQETRSHPYEDGGGGGLRRHMRISPWNMAARRRLN
jgi:hypothetical protein